MTNKKRLKALCKILKKIVFYPKSIFLVLKDESEYQMKLKKKYGINEFPTVDIREFLYENKAEVDHYTFLDGTSLITDLALIRSIARSIPNCNYLEIGTWRGESIMNVAIEAKHCTSVNLSPDEIIAMGMPEKYALQHGCLIQNQPNITTIHANSNFFDFNSLDQKFDLIFIDADHSYEGVKSDTEKIFSLLRDDNSIIVWHDYGFNTETPRYSVIAGILDGLPQEAHQSLYHVSNTMCAVYTKRKLETVKAQEILIPDKIFLINFNVNPTNQ